MIILEATGKPADCMAKIRDDLRQTDLPRRLASHADALVERAVHVLVPKEADETHIRVSIEPSKSFLVEVL
jgi:hypothetical protein